MKICFCTTCNYLLIHSIDKFPDMVSVGSLDWGYVLINGTTNDVMNVVAWFFFEAFSGDELLTWSTNQDTSHKVYEVQVWQSGHKPWGLWSSSLATWTQTIKFMKFKFGNMDTSHKVYEVQVWQAAHKP